MTVSLDGTNKQKNSVYFTTNTKHMRGIRDSTLPVPVKLETLVVVPWKIVVRFPYRPTLRTNLTALSQNSIIN